MGKQKKWSEEELRLLQRCVDDGKVCEEISQEFCVAFNFQKGVYKRTPGAVDRKCRELGLKLPTQGNGRKRRWTAEDEERLIRFYTETNLDLEEIAGRLDRTPKATYMRVKKLGLTREPSIGILDRIRGILGGVL